MDYIPRKDAVFETKRFRNYTIAAGRRHTVALKSDGTVTAVGDNDYGQCDVSGWSNIQQ
ncbi:RCC1 repeat protein [Paenibacillus polymyxa]|nr:RCC1 repeat protein [Paenibacillus polymyxa]